LKKSSKVPNLASFWQFSTDTLIVTVMFNMISI
jgi:hypothetical protein